MTCLMENQVCLNPRPILLVEISSLFCLTRFLKTSISLPGATDSGDFDIKKAFTSFLTPSYSSLC